MTNSSTLAERIRQAISDGKPYSVRMVVAILGDTIPLAKAMAQANSSRDSHRRHGRASWMGTSITVEKMVTYGRRQAVGRALSHMEKYGKVRRLSRGVYQLVEGTPVSTQAMKSVATRRRWAESRQ